jgi:uncharacterized membrane protein YpjA
MKQFFVYVGYVLALSSLMAIAIGIYSAYDRIKDSTITVQQIRQIVKEEISPLATSINTIKGNQYKLLQNDSILKADALDRLKKYNEWDKAMQIQNNFNNTLQKSVPEIVTKSDTLNVKIKIEKLKR